MKLFIFILVVSIASGVSKKRKHRHTTLPPEDDPEAVPEEATKLRDARQGFLLKGVLRQSFALETASSDAWNNVVCSPVSALLPLAKLALGAEGRSREELFEMIGVSSFDALSSSFKKTIKSLRYLPGVKLDICSRIYVSDQAELHRSFLKSSKDVFHSGVERISFKNSKHAADEINGWVSRQTNGKIPLLLGPDQISPDASLVLVNAIYFQGKWQYPFNVVGVSDFYAPTGIKKVQMMSRTGFYNYARSSVLNAQIVEIPYEGMMSSFIVILPNKNTGLPILLNQLKLAPKLLNEALRTMNLRRVVLSMPKFAITTTLDLKDMYAKIGIKHILGDQSGLTNIVKNEEVKVSSAIQKAVIEVHERGTEAAAASVVFIAKMAGPSPNMTSEEFKADHPFLFYVQSNCEQLFSGTYSEP